MFAIIKSGGKQYKIEPGDILKLEYLGLEKGSEITFDNILLYQNEGKSLIGDPLVKQIKVQGKVLENKSNKKVIVFKKRRRHNSRRLNGHKQKISVVQIGDILLDGKAVNMKTKSVTKNVPASKAIKETKPKTESIEKNKS